ncbi:hypothetical protein [Bradyrhizobium manausense]|nr:hypothetical protein [Bradyrhizobium manausense]
MIAFFDGFHLLALMVVLTISIDLYRFEIAAHEEHRGEPAVAEYG